VIKRAQMPAVKEPVSLMRNDIKRPDGTTLLPWARGKPMAWDVTVPDTYAESHISSTATKPGAAALKTAQNEIDKYAKLASTHIFYPFAVETAGTWHDMAIELTQEIEKRITTITEDTRETKLLFQRLSIALQRGKAVSFYHYGHRVKATLQPFFICLASIFTPAALCWWAKNNNNNNNNNNTNNQQVSTVADERATLCVTAEML